jgi:PAS domain S-box-containing protein
MKNHTPHNPDELRRQAKERLSEKQKSEVESKKATAPQETAKMLHELQVHQIELEMQNEQLHTAQTDIEAWQARYFDLYDLAPVGYCTLSDQGLILEANLTAANLLGMARGALVKQPFSRFILKDGQDIYYLQRQQLFLLGKPQECELRMVKPDGTAFWAHLTSTAAQAENGAPLCRVVLRDITEQKQTENTLRESEERFHQLFDKAPLGYQSLDSNGRFIEVNQAWLDTLGYKRDEVMGKWFGDFLAPEYVQAFREKFPIFKAKGKIHSEFFMMHKDGTRRYIAFDGRIGHNHDGSFKQTHCILKDETDRRKAEETLQRIRFSVDAASEAIFWITPDARIVDVNPAACRSLGYTREELLRLRVQDVDPHYSAETSLQRFSELRKLGSKVFESEHRTKDGRLFPVEIVDNYVKHGSDERSCSFVRDITRRKKAEGALREKERMIRAWIENSPVCTKIVDPDLNLKFMSASGIRELKIDNINEFYGKPYPFHFYPDSFKRQMTESLKKAKETGSVIKQEAAAKDIAGNTVWYHSTIVPVMDGQGKLDYLLVVSLETTARKAAEKALIESEMFARSTLDALSAHIAIVDDSGLILAVNKTWRKFADDNPPVSGNVCEGANYLDICDRSASEAPEAAEVASAIRSVLRGTSDSFQIEYACHSESEQRWFVARVTRFHDSNVPRVVIAHENVTERKMMEKYRHIGIKLLDHLNEPCSLAESIRKALAALKTETGFDAVGLRMQDDADFPYMAQEGFSHDFLLTENTLVERDKDGGVCRDKDGNVKLECTCGLVLSGKADPGPPLFTKGGSCWTNDSFPLLDLPPDQDPRLHPRNNCIHQGYGSVALIPIRVMNKIHGLLQLNDKRKGRFTSEMIEILEGIAAHIGAAVMRKQAEEALRKSDQQHRLLIEHLHAGVVVHAPDTQIILANKQASALLGLSVEQMMGKTAIDPAWCFVRDNETVMPVEEYPVQRVIAAGQPIVDLVIGVNRPATKDRVWILANAFPELDADGHLRQVVVTFIDITARKNMEEALRQSKELLSETERIGKVGGWSFNIDTMEQVWTDEVYHIHEMDISPNPSVEKGVNYYTRESRPIIEEAVRRAIELGEDFDLELEITTAKGNTRAVHTIGKADLKNRRIYGFFQDITERKQSAEESDALKEFLDSVAGFGFAKNTDLKYVSANKAFCDLLKIPYNKIQGLTDYDIFPADLAEKYIADDRRVLETVQPITVEETTFNATTNQRFTVQTRKFPRLDKQGAVTGIYGMGYDITALKQAEEALRQSEAIKFKLISNINDVIVIIDQNGINKYKSPNITKLFGWKPEELVGKNTWENVHPDDLEAGQIFFGRILAEPNATGTTEMRYKRKDGNHVWIEISVINLLHDKDIQGVLGNYHDITERMGAEAARRESDDKFRAAFMTGPDGFFWATLPEGRIIEINQSFESILGYTRKEAIGKTPLELGLYAEPGDRARMLALLQEKGTVRELELKGRKKGGALITVSLSINQVKQSGQLYSLGIIRDITEHKLAANALEKANEGLQATLQDLWKTQKHVIQQERLSALGQMASGIAHDFNNALMPIIGFSEILSSDAAALDNREEAIRMLKMIFAAGNDARQIVSRMRAIYRKDDESRYEMVDITELVQSAIAMTMPKWKEEMSARGITINAVTDLQPVPRIHGNASELRQSITNLIFNATDAMPDGGTMTFRIYSSDSISVFVEVTDTGHGMDELTLQRCMEAFFTTKGPLGSGLGLAMVHGIVERHGGVIKIESKPGSGTTVRIRFPVSAKTGITEAEHEKETAKIPPMKILVVDDEESSLNLMSRILRRDGHHVETAANGRDGLDILCKGNFDLIFTDRAMPMMGGDEFALKAQQVRPGIPAIMLTGFGEIMKDGSVQPPGISRVMSKPVTANDLRIAMKSVLINVATKD